MLYIKLWVKCFNKISKIDGYAAAFKVMTKLRKERSVKELTELNNILGQ